MLEMDFTSTEIVKQNQDKYIPSTIFTASKYIRSNKMD